jgi:uncharacterized protein YndB with AHSA1/START domain
MPPVINIGLRVCGAFAALIGLFWVIGLLLPHGYETSAEVVIEAPPEKIFPYLNRLDQWPAWSQWQTGKDSVFRVKYGPEVEGVGAVQTWQEPRGQGKLWITESELNRSLSYVVEFGDFPRMESRFLLTPREGRTVVTWKSSGRLPGGAFYGWLRLAFVNGMRDQYQQALLKLDAVVTGKPLPGEASDAKAGAPEKGAAESGQAKEQAGEQKK